MTAWQPVSEINVKSTSSVQAAKIFNVPLASIGILDGKRIWVKALYHAGLPADARRVKELPRHKSFMAHMLLSEKQEVMVVEDALEDSR